jgi:uncharacterized PurR-regulated membrane protein YhhQ (DUF165 family)
MAQKSGISVIVRSVVWIVTAGIFLGLDLAKIHGARNAGRAVTVGMAIQLILWLLVILFWSYTGLRGYKRRTVVE